MKSIRTKAFRIAYNNLPEIVKEKARKNYKAWLKDSSHSEVKFENLYDEY
jgi:hypothetical protein